MGERQIEHLIEIAVIHKTPPVDRDQVAAHDAIQIAVDMRALQQAEIAIELALDREHGAETVDRHVGEREQTIEDNAVTLAKLAPVLGFERVLRWRQRWALRIIDEI